MSRDNSRPRPFYPRDGTMVREARWEAPCRGTKNSIPEDQAASRLSLRCTNTSISISGSPLLKCVYVSLEDVSIMAGYGTDIKTSWNQNHRNFSPRNTCPATHKTHYCQQLSHCGTHVVLNQGMMFRAQESIRFAPGVQK